MTNLEAGTTISFSNGGGYWQTRYSFVPRCYFSVDNDLYSMPVLNVDNFEGSDATLEEYSGKEPFIWRHNVIEQPRNLFYNNAFSSSLTIVANYNPSMVKAFNAISIESNYNGWSGTFETNVSGPIKRLDRDYQQTTLTYGSLTRMEGASYASMPRSEKNSQSNIMLVGRLKTTSISRGSAVEITPSSEAIWIPQDPKEAMIVFADDDGKMFAYWRGDGVLTPWDTNLDRANVLANSVIDPDEGVDAFWPNHSAGVWMTEYTASGGVYSIKFGGDDIVFVNESGEEIQLDVAGTPSVYIVYDPKTLGDLMRGNYLKMTLQTNGFPNYSYKVGTGEDEETITVPNDSLELYAVNLDFEESYMNHSLG